MHFFSIFPLIACIYQKKAVNLRAFWIMETYTTYIEQQLSNPILRMVGREADAMHLECYVIGGWVRDLFLRRESKDIDIVVVRSEGAEELRSEGGRSGIRCCR